MPTGITASIHPLTRLALAPTMLALAGVPLMGEETPAPAPAPVKPAPVATTPAPTGAEQTLTVAGEKERTPKADEVTSTRLDLDLQHTPQSVTVINQDLLRTTGAFSLRDALRTAPGVTMAAGEGGRTGDSLSIRGFSANSDTYIDNLKDNGQYFRDTFNLEQVEVLKGPSGLYFGRGVTGGAVNLVTKKTPHEFAADASVTAGTDNFYRVQAGVGGPVADWLGARADAYYTNSESFRDEQELERWAIAPTATFHLLPNLDVTLQYMHQFEDSTMDYGVPVVNGRPVDVPIETYYGFADDTFQEFTVDQYTAFINFRLNDNLTLRNGTRYADYERYYLADPIGASTFDNPAMPGVWSFTGTQRLCLNEQENLQNQTEVAWNGTINERKLSVVVGVDLLSEEYEFKNETASYGRIDSYNPQQPRHNPAAPTGFDDTPNSHSHTDAQTIGGYAMVAYEFIPAWTAVLGARFDRFEAEYDNYVTAVSYDQTDNMFNPRAGLIWDPAEEVSVYASYATSSNPTAEAFSISNANAGLDPEENVNYEVGAKAELFERALLVTGAVFRLEKTNARIADPNNTAVNILDGLTRTDGFELGAAGTITKYVSVFAGYAFLDGEIVDTNTAGQEGNDSPNTPRHSGSMWLTWNIGWGLDVGAGVYAKSSSYTNTANTTTLPGYARFDAGAGWTGEHLYVRLNVFNLFDTVHYESGSTNYAAPGAPLSGQISVGATF